MFFFYNTDEHKVKSCIFTVFLGIDDDSKQVNSYIP